MEPFRQLRRIAERFEWHQTLKHGSWFNIAECELSTLARRCLHRRIPDRGRLEEQTRAWTTRRNQGGTAVNCRLSTDDARIVLAHLYPQIN